MNWIEMLRVIIVVLLGFSVSLITIFTFVICVKELLIDRQKRKVVKNKSLSEIRHDKIKQILRW